MNNFEWKLPQDDIKTKWKDLILKGLLEFIREGLTTAECYETNPLDKFFRIEHWKTLEQDLLHHFRVEQTINWTRIKTLQDMVNHLYLNRPPEIKTIQLVWDREVTKKGWVFTYYENERKVAEIQYTRPKPSSRTPQASKVFWNHAGNWELFDKLGVKVTFIEN